MFVRFLTEIFLSFLQIQFVLIARLGQIWDEFLLHRLQLGELSYVQQQIWICESRANNKNHE